MFVSFVDDRIFGQFKGVKIMKVTLEQIKRGKNYCKVTVRPTGKTYDEIQEYFDNIKEAKIFAINCAKENNCTVKVTKHKYNVITSHQVVKELKIKADGTIIEIR